MRVGASGVNLNDINITIAFLKLYFIFDTGQQKTKFSVKTRESCEGRKSDDCWGGGADGSSLITVTIAFKRLVRQPQRKEKMGR